MRVKQELHVASAGGVPGCHVDQGRAQPDGHHNKNVAMATASTALAAMAGRLLWSDELQASTDGEWLC
jgi:hypothetical protein